MAPTCNSFSGSKRPFPWFLLKTLYSFIVFIILRETKTFSESQWPLKASFWRLTWAILLGLWKPSGQVWAKASPGASRTSLRRITMVDWLGDADDVQPVNCDDGWSPRFFKQAQWLFILFYCFVDSKRYLKCICVLAFQKPFAPLPVSWLLFNAKLSSFRFRVSCYILISVFARPKTIQNCSHAMWAMP